VKDQVAAQALFEEIEMARLIHPNVRQSTAFTTRTDALMKRLYLRGNPASSTSSFPRPLHPLFPDQESSNEALAQALSSEITAAIDVAKKVEVMAKEYRESYDAVRRVEVISQDANTLSTTFMTIIDRLENGVLTSHGDGTPPDLSDEKCLDPSSHSVFLALLPSIMEELATASAKANQLVRNAHVACLNLNGPGIDPTFKASISSEVQRLSTLQERAQTLGNTVASRTSRLRGIREIWSIMGERLKDLEAIRRQLGEAMEAHRWRQQSTNGETPLTPDSPFATHLPVVEPSDLATQLDLIQGRLAREIESPLSLLSPTLEPSLNSWLLQSFNGLGGILEGVRQMARLLGAIQKQAAIMGSVRSEFEDFQIRIEDIKLRYDSALEQDSTGNHNLEEIANLKTNLNNSARNIRSEVRTFVDNLSQRIVFVSQRGSNVNASADPTFKKRRFSSGDLKLGASLQKIAVELPFDLSSLDDAVRGDSNSYAMQLSGELESLDRKANHFHLVQMSKGLDSALSSTIDDINLATQSIASFKSSFTTISQKGREMGSYASLLKDLTEYSHHQRTKIARSFSPIRELLRQMDSAPGAHDSAVHEVIYLSRLRSVDDTELKFGVWNTDVENLRNHITEALRLAQLEQERIAEVAEKERLAEQERSRLEEERLAEVVRLEEERRVREAEQQAAEAAEIAAQEERRALAEQERSRLEEERLAEVVRLEEERRVREAEQQAAEAAEIAAQEERRAIAEKERMAEEERLRQEKEQKAAEMVRLEEEVRAQELERRRVEEAERLARERPRIETEEHGGDGQDHLVEERPEMGQLVDEEASHLNQEGPQNQGISEPTGGLNSTVGSAVEGGPSEEGSCTRM
jgi:hypothetical protein